MPRYIERKTRGLGKNKRNIVPRIGIKELAELAGVSTATVSRALNTPERVSKKIRERVQATAKEVGYRPNQLGASLRTSRSNNIIAVIPDISDTFISSMVKSLKHTATTRGYSVLLGDTSGSREQELAYGDMIRSRQADGIIVFAHRLPFRTEDIKLDSFSFPPLVNSCEPIDTDSLGIDQLPYISIDNYQAGKDLTNHLISLGHKSIAVITGNMSSPSAQHRLEGYKAALEEAGIEFQAGIVYEGQYNLDAGIHYTREILLSKKRPTAIFCMCDETAIGSITTLRELGYDVPTDMSVVGIDNIPFAKQLYPSLTTISQPTEEIGRLCANTVIDIIEGRPIREKEIILEHTLIVRNSSKAIN